MAIFTVTNLDDSGDGSLRQAIEDTNATAGFDTINFDEELRGQTITLTSGELQITDELTINGLGTDELTVSGNNSSRVFNVNDGNDSAQIDVVIDGLTITDGFTDERLGGSGIRNSENLTVTNSNISGNEGKGISVVDSGLAEVTSSTISDNGSIGIFLTGFGIANVIDSTISGNAGSGINLFFGDVKVTNSIISDNVGGINGGKGNIVEVTNSNISGNAGLGISLFDFKLDVTNSTISDNGSRGITLVRTGADITNSTISDNGDIGIVAVRSSGADVINSTISGNEGGGLWIANQGIENSNAKVTNSTITGNTADDGGGGIYVEEDSPFPNNVEIENTIIAGNFDNSSAGNELKPDVSGNFTSSGYNLIGDGTGSTGFDADGDQVGTSENPIDPLLGTLQDNGGSTQTHALFTDSPAIDTGNPDFEPPSEFDQRGAGFPRVLDGDGDGTATVDIGAFELPSSLELDVGLLGIDCLGFNFDDLSLAQQGDDALIAALDMDIAILTEIQASSLNIIDICSSKINRSPI